MTFKNLIFFNWIEIKLYYNNYFQNSLRSVWVVSVNSSFSGLSFSKLKINGCFLLLLFTEYVADKLYNEFFKAMFSFSKVSTFCFKIFDSFNNLYIWIIKFIIYI